MKSKKKNGRKRKALLAIFMAFAMTANLTACSGGNTASKTPKQETTEQEQTEENETIGQPETAYNTDEEANPEITMENMPISSFWFPNELLEWNPNEDEDLQYNISTVPLAVRAGKDKLTPVNETQSKDTKVVAISIMNSSTSGNSPHGTYKFASNTFSYWQYADLLVYWGGSSGEGLIVPPSPDVTDAAHKNGVPVLGTVFFPQAGHGGKIEWLDDFLKKDESGNFPMTDKLIEVAEVYGFDGWFLNQETETTEEQKLTQEHAVLMQEFIKQLKEKSQDKLEIMWYDSMTKEGNMDWQNALTDENSFFMVDAEGNPVADSMFLNFWWTNEEHVEEKLLEASNEKAVELGIDPYEIYAGVDIQANGTLTPIRWDLFEEGNLSLGLYCPSWTYFSAGDFEEFENKENMLWVNRDRNPSVSSKLDDTEWRGVSTYAIEKTAVTSVPFVTNFNMGNGYSFFVDGEKASGLDWNNRSMADISPTYRWIIENEGTNQLSVYSNYADAYYGGNSLKFRGSLEAGKASTIKLYSADLQLEEGVSYTTAAKSDAPIALDLVLEFHDGSSETFSGDKPVTDEWTVVEYDISAAAGKAVKTISYKVTSEEGADPVEFNLGNISITKKDAFAASAVSNLKVDNQLFDDEAIYAGVRLSWDKADEGTSHYEIYRINDDNTKTLLGATPNASFFANGLQRTGDSNTTKFEVLAVNKNYVRGEGTETVMEWPDNSIPKADFKASKTLAAPGESITFESLCSQNTESVEWSFEGADQTTSTEKNPSVSYSKEGVYSVVLTAKNESGNTVKEEEQLITISSKVTGELENLSEGKNTEASAFVNNNEAPEFAVDGKTDTKWCATGTPPHNITIDLGEVKAVSQVSMAHAEAGNESPDMNTMSYTIEVSEDGENFTEVFAAKKNSLGNTVDTFKAVNARYVRLNVVKPTQGSDSAARIYEVQVFGIQTVLE